MKTKEELGKEFELLKSKYKTIYTAICPLNDDDDCQDFATIYLRKVDRQTMSLVSKITGDDPYKGVEAVLRNCYIGGDDLKSILENEDAFLSCVELAGKMMTKKQAEVKKN